jgi:cytochrome c3-like protein
MNLCCLVALVLVLASVLLLSAQQSPADAPLLADLHQAKGLACTACHKESSPKTAVSDQVCIACHGGVPAIVARTDNYEPNPHVSPHSTELQCSTCHHAHKPSEVACRACHTDKTFIRQ